MFWWGGRFRLPTQVPQNGWPRLWDQSIRGGSACTLWAPTGAAWGSRSTLGQAT